MANTLSGELSHEIFIEVWHVVFRDSADFVTMRTLLGEDLVKLVKRNSLLVDPVVEQQVEERPHDSLLPAPPNTSVHERPHHHPRSAVGHAHNRDLEQSATVEVHFNNVLEANHLVLGQLVVIDHLHPLLEVVVTDTEVRLLRQGSGCEDVLRL